MTNNEIKVLDKGYIKLITHCGTDDYIAETARVSTQSDGKDNKRLIRYLLRHSHLEPFEFACIVLEVKAPIFVARQWFRQRMASYNEQSLRYTKSDLEFYMYDEEDQRIKDVINPDSEIYINAYEYIFQTNELQTSADAIIYNEQIESGIPRELARINLPLSTYTKFRFKIDLNNLIKFLNTRTDSHAQFEIQEYARAIETIFQELFPYTFEGYIDYIKESVSFSRMEMEILKDFIEYAINQYDLDEYMLTNLTESEQKEFLNKIGVRK